MSRKKKAKPRCLLTLRSTDWYPMLPPMAIKKIEKRENGVNDLHAKQKPKKRINSFLCAPGYCGLDRHVSDVSSAQGAGRGKNLAHRTVRPNGKSTPGVEKPQGGIQRRLLSKSSNMRAN